MPIKVKGYSHNKNNAKKNQKRADAEARNHKWAQLTKAQQLASLKERPGKCARQIAKIESFNTNR